MMNLLGPLLAVSLVLPIATVEARTALKPNKFRLVPTSCVLSGENNGQVKSMSGENTPLTCEIKGKILKCGQSNPSEEYNLDLDMDGVFLARSKSGNVYILGERNTKKYSIASSHLIAETASLMTKHCAGKIE